jgi:hypothetical protein
MGKERDIYPPNQNFFTLIVIILTKLQNTDIVPKYAGFNA